MSVAGLSNAVVYELMRKAHADAVTDQFMISTSKKRRQQCPTDPIEKKVYLAAYRKAVREIGTR